MSRNTRFKKAEAFVCKEMESLSGAKKENWEKLPDPVFLAVYFLDELTMREPFRHKDVSCVALSPKKIDEKLLRFRVSGKIFDVLSVNFEGRFCRYFLKEVTKW